MAEVVERAAGVSRAGLALALLVLAGCRSPGAEPASRPASSQPPGAPASARGPTAAADDDPRVRWLARHAIRLRSVSPADRDFSDLEPLRPVLDGVRVVFLGEPSHGDGTVFLAKTRLIEFLHQRLGFDVLAFESGLYDCARAWERLRSGEDAATAVPRGVFPIWTASRELQPLLAYLEEAARSARPLELAGFDDQLTSSASREELVGDLAALLRRIGSSMPDGPEWPAFSAVLQSLAENAFRRPPPGGAWLRQPLLSRPLGYLEMRADWGEVLDGLLYLRTMAPSTRALGPEQS
jgi:erythromycin esterase